MFRLGMKFTLGRRIVDWEVTGERAGNAHGWRTDHRQRWLLAMLVCRARRLPCWLPWEWARCMCRCALLVDSAIGGRPLSADQRVILFAIRLPRIVAAAS